MGEGIIDRFPIQEARNTGLGTPIVESSRSLDENFIGQLGEQEWAFGLYSWAPTLFMRDPQLLDNLSSASGAREIWNWDPN